MILSLFCQVIFYVEKHVMDFKNWNMFLSKYIVLQDLDDINNERYCYSI
jgi:hypothetical protein